MTPKERVTRKIQAWRRCLLDDLGKPTAAGEEAIKDLIGFCKLRATTLQYDAHGRLDPLAHARWEGRREVALRIMERLYLEDRWMVNLREVPSDE